MWVPAEAGFAVQHADGHLPSCSAELKGLDRVEGQWQQPHVSPSAPIISVYASLTFAQLQNLVSDHCNVTNA